MTHSKPKNDEEPVIKQLKLCFAQLCPAKPGCITGCNSAQLSALTKTWLVKKKKK